MPPTRHSSSSHSSGSSSRSSFSGSRPSRSFSSSSRPSSRSSSSHSSFSGSSSFSWGGSGQRSFPGGSAFSLFNHSSGPSPRSSTSHSSAPNRPFTGKSNPNTTFRPSSAPTHFGYHGRPRINQPLFRTDLILPIIKYCSGHDYYYFDRGWDYAGQHYDAGYYDENGKYYSNIDFASGSDKEQKSSTVELTCEYCGCKTIIDLSKETELKCSACGAPLSMKDDASHSTDSTPNDTLLSEEQFQSNQPQKKRSSFWKILLWVFIALVVFRSCGDIFISGRRTDDSVSVLNSGTGYYQNVSGNVLYLKRDSFTRYNVADSKEYSKALKWDSDAGAYYDPDTETWVWLNTDVSPAIWQYWIEGHSSRFGDYGWMEYEDGKWYVEKSENNWVKYTGDTSSFWHIE